MDATVATSHAQPIVVSIVDGDAVEDITEATGEARRLAALKRLRAETLKEKLNVPRAIFTFDREISELERGIRSRSCGEKQINQVLRRSVEENRVKEQEAVDQARKRARRRAQKARQEKRAAKAKAKAKAAAAKATVERMRRLAALPMRFTKADLGVGQQSFKTRSSTLLERIRLNSPALPEAEALQWVDLRDRYARQFKVDHPVGYRRPLREGHRGGAAGFGRALQDADEVQRPRARQRRSGCILEISPPQSVAPCRPTAG